MEKLINSESGEKIVLSEKLKKRKKLIIPFSITIFILTIFVISFSILFRRETPQNHLSLQASLNSSATQVPFSEMTIPSLRSRKYNSNLEDLEEVSRNTDYTSYLTSYNSDGFRINGLLTIPIGEEPEGGWPAIVFVHGYIPPSNYQTLENYSSYVDYLSKNGFVVFKIDLRGHGNSEGEAGGGYFGADYVVDVLNAKNALQNSGFVNSKQIGFWGHSMAGNIVARAMASSSETPAISIWAGAVYTYSDLQEYGIDDNSYRPPDDQSKARKRRNELFKVHGQFDPNNSFWKQVPMTNYLDGIDGAIQLNHAVNDDVVSIKYSKNFNSILDKTNIPHELHEYQSGGHNITGESFTEAMSNTVSFFKKYLN